MSDKLDFTLAGAELLHIYIFSELDGIDKLKRSLKKMVEENKFLRQKNTDWILKILTGCEKRKENKIATAFTDPYEGRDEFSFILFILKC